MIFLDCMNASNYDWMGRSKQINGRVNLKQGSKIWLEWRAQGIGSSDAAVVMGLDPCRDANDLLLDKIGKGKPIKSNPAMERGSKFEGAARATFFFDNNVECEPGEFIHQQYDFIRASLDGVNREAGFFAEIKYMGLKNWQMIFDSKKPLPHHMIQMQHQFAVTGLPLCYYVAYTLTEDFRMIDKIQYVKIAPDLDYINNQLIPAEIKFWDLVTLEKEKKCKTNNGH